MPAILDSLRVVPLPGRRTKVRAMVSGKLKLAEGSYVYLNGMRLVHGPKGLFLSFPAWQATGVGGVKGEFSETYFLGGPDKKAIEQQAIIAFNKKQAA